LSHTVNFGGSQISRVVKKLERLRPDVYNPTELTEFEQPVIDVGIETEGPSRD